MSEQIRLCDAAGMVSHERVEPGSHGTEFDSDLTYLRLLNNLRSHTGLAPVAEPFHCTGSAHLAGMVFQCTSPAHADRGLAMSTPVDCPAAVTAGEGQQDQRCTYGHTKADHDAVGACERPSLTAREVAAVHYPDPVSALRIAFERGWDAATAQVDARVQAAELEAQELAQQILAMRVELDTARAEVQAAANQQPADAWDEGFEAAAQWAAHNPGPGGIPHDPPRNPYDAASLAQPAPGAGQHTPEAHDPYDCPTGRSAAQCLLDCSRPAAGGHNGAPDRG